MLEELRLENFVLFDRAAFAFVPGLNVISGETGAGKSLAAAALSQALGARALPEHIRREADAARVAAVFRPGAAVRERLPPDLREFVPADGPLVFERVLRRGGSSRLSVGGRPAAAPAVKALAAVLVDFAAQHEAQALADPLRQRELLDRFGRLGDLTQAFARLHAEASGLVRRLAAGDAEKERVGRRAGELRDWLDRFDAFGFDPGSDPRLEERIRELAHAARLAETAALAQELLYDADDAVVGRVDRLRREVGRSIAAAAAFASADERLQTALEALGEAAGLLQNAAEAASDGADSLDALIARSEAAKALAKRLGAGGVDALGARAEALRAELAALADWDADEDAVRAELARRLPPLASAGRVLSAKRKEAAAKLARAAGRELADLEMPGAEFSARLDPRWTEADGLDSLLDLVDAGGLETVEFLLAANPGETPARLSAETSGGETSRALLALKAALGDALGAPVLFLDEIDAGVGGRLGASLGRKLRKLACDRQVICITHLPQIAAAAARHFTIAKTVRKGRTFASARTLEGDDRVEEIALMIHGSSATDTTRRQAREMLAAAERPGKGAEAK